ncbi:MAG: cation:proton antiporter [Planctomycetota bacterium]
MHDWTPLYLAAVLALGTSAQWIAWRLQLPAIVLLLGFGVALGQLAGPPDEYIGDALLPMVSLAVGVILFEGGLSLKFSEVQGTGGVVARLVTVGLLVTWIGGTLAARLLMGFSWPIATLLGALLTVSGPTVILPLLRQVRPDRRVGSIIKWEGIVNDPIGAVLAALVFEAVRHVATHDVALAGAGGVLAGETLRNLAFTLVIGLTLGGATAALVIGLLSRYLVPDYLQNPVILGLVIVVFAVSNYLSEESGLITVTVLGLLLANQDRVTVKHVVEFKENLRVLLISVLFIVLSSRVPFGWQQLGEIGWGGLAFLAAIILVIRPIAAGLATVGSDLRKNERLLLCWIHPRGIVAAAVASLLALEFEGTAMQAEADRMVLAAFLVIVGTVAVYGLSLSRVAKALGLAGENPQGVLFAGASPMIREIATSLKTEGFDTLLVDTNPQNISAARMAGLPVCYASIGSNFVHEETDLGDIGRLVAMTPNDEVNSLAATEFAEQFGTANVYQFASPPAHERHERVPSHRRGRTLFADGVTHDALQLRFSAGAVIKKTTLTEDFKMDDFRNLYPSALLLFVIPEKGQLTICSSDHKIEPKAGKKLIALVDADEATAAGESGILR